MDYQNNTEPLLEQVEQEYDSYNLEDHQTWEVLCQNQIDYIQKSASQEFLDGFSKLDLDRTNIAKIEELSRNLESVSGWTLVPVTGLLPNRDFFYLLINKKYPVTIHIRKPYEINFSEQPDIFHDVCGHLPLLTNEKFTRFLTAYCIVALKYIHNEKALDLLGKLYWYTYETGLIKKDGAYFPYGGAIITSSEEIENFNRSEIPKHTFDLQHIFRSEFSPYSLQKEYFVIESFDDLFNCIDEIEPTLINYLRIVNDELLIDDYSLNETIGPQFRDVIGFLNDMQYKYPEAISFVSGQPDETFFQIDTQLSSIEYYVDYLMRSTGKSREAVLNKIGQYSKTKGIVNDILANHLSKEENIKINGEQILITVGAQEAFAVIVTTLCNRENDEILIEDPSYIGLSSYAHVFGYSINGVQTDDEGIETEKLEDTILEREALGKKVKLVYVIPDYQNPSGFSMSILRRQKLLDLAKQYNFFIVEDSVYNSFTYLQKKNPTLKSLDRFNRVIYVGSFSKSLFPGLRIGMIVANQQLKGADGNTIDLIDQMAKVKVQLTNNTSTISQAILGGVLLSHQGSLNEWNQPKFDSYKNKRDCILNNLDKHIGKFKHEWAKDISWNKPDGGFFIKMNLPFEVDDTSVAECASGFNIIICPMRYFYLNDGGEKEIRITFSNLSIDKIDEGIKQLALYLKSNINHNNYSV
ncbi:MAG: aminotransferase class I/II-fold pyridoxal phosphate-dependent enzyme [Fluviicola sp.]|nr:aminotransferase class I/II-fold pyridoxal phosphate-dependent enzyme [Fluviicola sp.]